MLGQPAVAIPGAKQDGPLLRDPVVTLPGMFFQCRSDPCVHRNESIAMSGPTSAGKSLVAEQAIQEVLGRGSWVIDCSPTKSWSNQESCEFFRKFGGRVRFFTRSGVVLMSHDVLVSFPRSLFGSWCAALMA